MNAITLYDKTSGRLGAIWQYTEPGFPEANENETTGVVDGAYDGITHYILDGELMERPDSPVTRTDLTLHDVPTGATLFINGESYAAEGTVELEFALMGTYTLKVECFPYLDWTDEVTV